MKKLINLTLILLCCLLIQSQPKFAQTTSAENILTGKIKTLVKPVYPPEAAKAKVGGAVKVNVTVDEQGSVVKADAVSGEMMLRDSALAAARASKFSPNLVNGKSVKMSGALFFIFFASDLSATSSTTDDSDYLNSKTDFWGEFAKVEKSNSEPQNVPKRLDGNACLTMTFKVLDRTTYKSKLVDAQTLNSDIKACDDSIKTDASKPFKFYNRGLARYYLIRGDETPLGTTLRAASTVSAEDLRQSLADLKIFIDWEANNRFPNEVKMAYRAAGELTAVSAIKEQNREGLQAALKLLYTAEKSKAELDSADEYTNKFIAADRQTINAVLGNNTAGGTGGNSPLSAEVSSRYQKYAGEYVALEAVYKTKVQSFQEILKTQQGSSTPDTVKVCPSLSEMNSSFQAMKTSFANISRMKTNGELSGDANLVTQIETREAQQARVQSQISATAAKFGCQLK